MPDAKPDPLSDQIDELRRQQALEPSESRKREIDRLANSMAAKDLLRQFVDAHSEHKDRNGG